jgi:uncharacterized protein (DUF934 family)
MRQIIRRREIVADTLRYPGEESLPGTRRVQPLKEFLAAAGAAAEVHAAGSSPAAVLVGPSDEVDALRPHLQGVDLIVVEFPKLGDGRGFSQGRILRQRGGFRGELRARGALKRDHLFFLARCGFDSFDLDPGEDLSASLAAFDSFTVAYQDGAEGLVHVRLRQSA